MMIGPTNYIDMSISGKSYEEAKKEIQNLWKDIRRLKKLIEEVPDAEEMLICPSPGVQINTYKDYLEAARDYFESQGWEYVPTKEEIADKKFNDRLKDVQSIEVRYGAALSYRGLRTITFDGSKIVLDADLYNLYLPPEKKKQNPYENMTKETLLEELADLHIGEWKRFYENDCVLDGIEWSVTFKYLDKKEKTFSGGNRYPYNFYSFLDVMQIEPLD